jgi:hypothetical protein
MVSLTKNPQSVIDEDWVNVVNAKENGTSYAYVLNTALNLHCQLFNFDFDDIPDDYIISGITVECDAWFSLGLQESLGIKLSWNGGSTWTSGKIAALSSSETTKTFGGATDTWGRTWTVGEIKSTDFRTQPYIAARRNIVAGDEMRLDWLRVTVYYSEPVNYSSIINTTSL